MKSYTAFNRPGIISDTINQKKKTVGFAPVKKLHKEIEVTQNYRRKLLPVICAKSDQIRKF